MGGQLTTTSSGIKHAQISLFAGDDWTLAVTYADVTGKPIDLTGATIKWALINADGRKSLDDTQGKVTIATDPTTGQASIVIPASVTTSLAEGRYTDMHRVVNSGGAPSTLLTGPINVTADPWYVDPNATIPSTPPLAQKR